MPEWELAAWNKMTEPENNTDDATARGRKWAVIRLGVGLGQTIAGFCGLLLVAQSGINALSLTVLYVAIAFILTSLVLFQGPPTETRASLAKKVVSEFLGTFALVFAGTGAIVISWSDLRRFNESGALARAGPGQPASRHRMDLPDSSRSRGVAGSAGMPLCP